MTSSGPLFVNFVKPRLDGTQEVEAGLRAMAAAEAPDTVAALAPAARPADRQPVPHGSGVDARSTSRAGSQLDVALMAPPQVTAELLHPGGAVRRRRGPRRLAVADGRRPGARPLARRACAPAPASRSRLPVGRATRRRVARSSFAEAAPAPTAALPLLANVTRFDRIVTDAAVTVEVQRRGSRPRRRSRCSTTASTATACRSTAATAPRPKVDAGETLLRLRVKRAAAERAAGDVGRRPGGRRGPPPAVPGRARAQRRHRLRPVRRRPEPLEHGQTSSAPKRPWTSPRPGSPSCAGRSTTSAWRGAPAASCTSPRPTAARPSESPRRASTATHPEWSPDGSRLAYTYGCVRVYDAGCRVAVLDLDSGQETVVGAGAAPDWSPDGERLVVVRVNDPEMDMDTDLWTIRLEDGRAERITNLSSGVDEPVWSPTDDRIAFSRLDDYSRETEFENDAEIYVVDADGGSVRNLTNDDDDCTEHSCRGDRRDDSPSWSPDGRRIAFVSTQGEQPNPNLPPTTTQVWEMRADGTGARKRTSSPSWKVATAWRSAPWLETDAAPRCFDLDVAVHNDASVKIPLDCADDNGDLLTLRIAEGPAHGTLTPIGEDGSVRYTPAAGWTGVDEFVYDASDDLDTSGPARVRITVTAPPPPPPPPRPRRLRGTAASSPAAAWAAVVVAAGVATTTSRAARAGPSSRATASCCPARRGATSRSAAAPATTCPAARAAGCRRRRAPAVAWRSSPAHGRRFC